MFAPSGLGVDCWRPWEALAQAGVVPIMEKGMGLERTWAQLPAVFIPHFRDLTPAWLEQAWAGERVPRVALRASAVRRGGLQRTLL